MYCLRRRKGGEYCIPPLLDRLMTGAYLTGSGVRSWRSLVLDCERDLGTIVVRVVRCVYPINPVSCDIACQYVVCIAVRVVRCVDPINPVT